MSVAATGIIDTIVSVLEDETLDIKAGRFSRIAATAERKARLMHLLSQVDLDSLSPDGLAGKLDALRKALKSNLRACRENVDSLKEIIALHLAVEQEMDNDGTYAIPARRPHSS